MKLPVWRVQSTSQLYYVAARTVDEAMRVFRKTYPTQIVIEVTCESREILVDPDLMVRVP